MIWSDYFYYDESSPSCLRWATEIRRGKHYNQILINVGDVAGTFKNELRWQVRLKGKSYQVHRIVWELCHGKLPEGLVIDHINQDASCNLIGNLRAVTQAVNSRNQRLRNNCTSGKMGVCIVTDSRGNDHWRASWTQLDGRRMHKHYSVRKFGYAAAERLATEYRDEMIKQLNLQGAGYSERHGKEMIE